MNEIAIPKKLAVVYLDNICPAVYHLGQESPIDFIPEVFKTTAT